MSSSVTAVRDMKHLQEVLAQPQKEKNKLVVLEFVGSVKTYKAPCDSMKQNVEKIASEKRNDAYFYTVDVDSNEFEKFLEDPNLQALPTFWLLKDTKKVPPLVKPDMEGLRRSIENALKP